MTTYYVDPSWGGTESGTEAEPYNTFAEVRALYANNDTVLFKGGETLAEEVVNNKNDITFSSYGTGRATLAGDGVNDSSFEQTGRTGVTIENLDITGGLLQCIKSQSASDNFTITNVRVYDGPRDGIICNDGDDLLIENVEVHGCARYGVRTAGDATENTGTVLRGLNVHDNGKLETAGDNWDGIFVGDGETGFLVEDCRSTGNGLDGQGANFDFSAGGAGIDCIGTIRRCFASDGWMGIAVSGDVGVGNLKVENCISVNHDRGNYEMHGPAATLVMENCYGGGTAPVGGLAGACAGVKWASADATTGHTLTMTNCIIDATNYPYAMFSGSGVLTATTITNCCLPDVGTVSFYKDDTVDETYEQFATEFSPTGIVTADPLLDSEYFPNAGSPCISAGTTKLSEYDYHTRPNVGTGDHIGAKWPKLGGSSVRRKT